MTFISDCEVWCEETYGEHFIRSREHKVQEYDAVIFAPALRDDVPKTYKGFQKLSFKPNALKIFLQWESPYFHRNSDMNRFNHIINATMTYRDESYFYLPYGSIILNKLRIHTGFTLNVCISGPKISDQV